MHTTLRHELKRKTLHLLAGILLVVLALYSQELGKRLVLLILSFFLIALLEIEFIRIELKKKIPLIQDLWRKKEHNRIGGEVFFVIGGILSIGIFDTNIAVAAILMTTFGDLAAALIGKAYGTHWLPYPKNKAWEGVLAELGINLLIGFLTLPHPLLVIVMAFTATLVETFSIKLDDNLLIPLFAGFNAQIILFLLQLFKLL